jgi:hypothetical protein
MDPTPTLRDLAVAARATTLVAYAGGVAGVAAGAAVLRDGETALAVIVWTLTFAFGASMMSVGVLLRALAAQTVRTERIERDVATIRARLSDADRP